MRMCKLWCFIGLFFGLLPNVQAAQTATASLRFTVLKNGQPLPYWPLRLFVPGGSVPSLGSNYTLIGPDGVITFNALPPGNATVVVKDPVTPGRFSNGEGTTQRVVLQADTVNTATIEFHTGRVTGIASLLSIPIPGAFLRLTSVTASQTGPNPLVSFNETADVHGQFDFEAPPGTYSMVLYYGDSTSPLGSGRITVTEGQTSVLSFTPSLKNPALIFGRVVRGGQRFPGVYLSVSGGSSNSGRLLLQELVGEDGQFVAPLPPGSYTITVSDTATFPDTGLNSTATLMTSRTVTLKPNSRFFVNLNIPDRYLFGTITRYGQPLAGAKVDVVNTGSSIGLSSSNNRSEARTDAAGRYRVRISFPQSIVGITSPAGESLDQVFLAKDSTLSSLNFDWKPQQVSGVVKTKNGDPVAGLALAVAPNTVGTRTGPDGSFTLDVKAAISPSGNFLYGGGLDWILAEPKYLSKGMETTLSEVTLPAQPGHIEGIVREAKPDGLPGDPISCAQVTVYSNGVVPIRGSVLTDAAGRFSFESVPSTQLNLSVGATLYLSPDEILPGNNGSPVVYSQIVKVTPSATPTVEMLLKVGRLDARVQFGGNPASLNTLWLKKTSGSFSSVPLYADSQGEYHALLNPGNYLADYAPRAQVVVPGVAPPLATRLVQTVDVQAGQTSTLLLRVNRLDPLWVKDLGPGAGFHQGAVTHNHVAYLGSDDGTLMAVRAEPLQKPELLWKTSLFSPIHAKPLLVADRLFVATTDGRLHAFDIPDGLTPVGEAPGFPISLNTRFDFDPIWSPGTDASGGVSDPLNGEVLLTANSPQPAIYRVNASTGVLVKTLALPSPALAEPLPVETLLVVPLSDNRTVAIKQNGTVAWERDHPANRAVLGRVAFDPQGRLVQGSESGTLEVLLPDTGKVSSSWPTVSPFSLGMENGFTGIRDRAVASASGDDLIAPAGTLGLLAFQAKNGQIDPQWPWTTPDPFGLGDDGGYSNANPLRFLSTPTDEVINGDEEYLYATATLEPSFLGDYVRVSGLNGTTPSVFLQIPMAHPGNDYSVVYGDVTDSFVGQPAVTGPTPDDLVLVPTSNGRLYAFPVTSNSP